MLNGKLKGTEIHSNFGDEEIILSFKKQQSGFSKGGKRPAFMIFYSEYISGQPVKRTFSNFTKIAVSLNVCIDFIGIWEIVKDTKITPQKET